MNNNRRKRKGFMRNNSPLGPSGLLSQNANQLIPGTSEVSIEYQLLCGLIEGLEKVIRDFLEEVDKGEFSGLLDSRALAELVQDLVIYARYQRFDAGCYKKEADKLRHLAQNLPQKIVKMEERLAKIKFERKVVLADLRDIKKRRRNRRRRR